MKIVQVIDQLNSGGAERVCINLVNLLYRNKISVKLIVLNSDGVLFDLVDKGIEVIKLNKNKNKNYARKELRKHIQHDDIIHVHMRTNYKFVRKALLFSTTKKPIILHDHYGKIMITQKIPKFYRSILKPHFYIGCTQLLTQWAINKVRMNPNNVFFVNNFVLKQDSVSNNNNKTGLVLVGSLKRVKNHKLAIDIAKALNKKLSIYCSTLKGEKNYYQELIDYLNEINYLDNVRFVTGCTNVQAELKKYELALLTSTSEGDPLALIEYLAQGIPFLTSNVGEAVNLIKEYFPFLVQEEFNIDSWITNYHKAIKISPNEIEKIYTTHFSDNLYFEKYLGIYKKILKYK